LSDIQVIVSKLFLTAILVLVASNTLAQQVSLTSDEIVRYLSDREIEGNQNGMVWRQTFSADGRTSYEEVNGSRPSAGRWKAQNDEYCSQWPPSDIWSCYKMTAEEDRLTFIPRTGDPWPASRLEKK